MRSTICAFLSDVEGLTIETANDGEQALELVKRFAPDLIVLDWNMPRMNGLEFLEEYRASKGKAAVVVVVTEQEQPRVTEARALGAVGHIVKPFDADDLIEHVSAARAKLAA